MKLNLEANHALLAGHTFEHEIASAVAFGILGSLDVNRGDPLLGWDTDQFPNDMQAMTIALYQVILAGKLGKGGLNFDARRRRQSIDAGDLIHAGVDAVDLCARAFLNAAKLVEDGELSAEVAERYAGWYRPDARAMMDGSLSLEEISNRTLARNANPRPRSGRQERLENLLNRSLF